MSIPPKYFKGQRVYTKHTDPCYSAIIQTSEYHFDRQCWYYTIRYLTQRGVVIETISEKNLSDKQIFK